MEALTQSGSLEESAGDQKKENAAGQQPQSPSEPPSQDEGPTEHVATRPPPPQSPIERTRLETLPALDSLASQILAFLSRLSPSEAMGLSNTPNSPTTKEYAAMRALFDPARRWFYTGSPFLSPKDLGYRDNSQVEVIRKANQAIFVSSVFTGEIGLRDMDRSFLSVFVPDYGKLLKALASIYLELKTQGFITAWRTGAAPPHVVMADLFGPDLDKQMLARRPGTTTLAPTEQDFLNRLSSRREILQGHVKSNTLDQLPIKYKWEDFSREVSSYLSKNIENAANSAAAASTDPNRNDPTRALQRGQMEGQFSIHGPPLPVSSGEFIFTASQPNSSTEPSMEDDFVAQAARAAEIAMQDALGYGVTDPVNVLSSPNTPNPQRDTPTPQPALLESQEFEAIAESVSSRTLGSGQDGISDEIPHASQTAPTSVLYKRARLAATKASLAAAKKVLPPSQRRPWTTEEENALMTGLDQVKGPHWSQILAMYGPGGTVSEALKDRNQVQLKDKARNLKLFFLKGGIEVPYYLKYVTGDLRTRAPTQASKQEARERDRLLSEGDEAFLDGETPAAAGLADSNASDSPGADDSDLKPLQNEAKPTIEPSMADVEAMIARAAAQAAQSLGSD